MALRATHDIQRFILTYNMYFYKRFSIDRCLSKKKKKNVIFRSLGLPLRDRRRNETLFLDKKIYLFDARLFKRRIFYKKNFVISYIRIKSHHDVNKRE